MKQSKTVNKRFHNIVIYLKIIYRKIKDTEIDREYAIKIYTLLACLLNILMNNIKKLFFYFQLKHFFFIFIA